MLGRPEGTKDEDCGALPVAAGVWRAPSGQRQPVVVSCWKPTPEEREHIANGGTVFLHIIGRGMPPVLLSTKQEAALTGQN